MHVKAEFVYLHLTARMVKLVDTLVSGAGAHKLAGSSPVPGTKKPSYYKKAFFYFFEETAFASTTFS